MKKLIASCIICIASISSASVFASDVALPDSAESANLVIYRSDKPSANGGISYRLWVDGSHLGKLQPGKVIALNLTEGEHVITSSEAKSKPFVIQVVDQKVTYIEGDIAGQRKLLLAMVQPTDELVATLKLAESKDSSI